jgi:hypothetical protein
MGKEPLKRQEWNRMTEEAVAKGTTEEEGVERKSRRGWSVKEQLKIVRSDKRNSWEGGGVKRTNWRRSEIEQLKMEWKRTAERVVKRKNWKSSG